MDALFIGSETGEGLAVAASLEASGVSVTQVSTLRAALARLRARTITDVDCVVCTAAAVRDRVPLLGRVREARPDCPLVVLVGRGDGDLVTAVRTAGATTVLFGGATGEDVATQVVSLVEERAADRDATRQQALRETICAVVRTLVAEETAEPATVAVRRLVDRGLFVAGWVCTGDGAELTPQRAVGLPLEALAVRTVPESVDAGADSPVTVLDGDDPTVVVSAGEWTDGTAASLVLVPPPDRTPVDVENDLLSVLAETLGAITRGEEPTARGTDAATALEAYGAVVSHELRNQLQTAERRLRELDDDPDARADVELILHRLDRLADEASVLARGASAIEIEPDCILSSHVRAAWRRVDAPDATLSVATDQRVDADPQLLELLLENLLRNSVDHGGPTVSVSVETTETGFAVLDDGPGVPPEERSRLFEWGYSGADGTGVGLAVVDRIAAAHGWELTVESSDVGGARFVVDLGEPTSADAGSHDESPSQ